MSALRTSMSSNISFTRFTTRSEYQSIYYLISLLNKHLSEADFICYAADMYEDTNYSLYGIYVDELLAGVCGCWVTTKFYTGKYLEIDNFIIDPTYRGQGLGKAFVAFIESIAKKQACKMMMLDAYLENEAAHIFYKAQGFTPKGYHFLKEMK